MKLSNILLNSIIGATFTYVVSACFTGIESTPKITSDNVKSSGATFSDEQIFASHIVSEAPRSWVQGKSWLVSDPKIALTFTPASDKDVNIVGKILKFSAAKPVVTLTGENAIELTLTSDDGHTFYHRTGISASDWKERPSYSIPFTVELSAVAVADSMMKGNIYYITTPRWYDNEERDITGQRHVPVKIIRVEPGNHLYSLKVVFSQVGQPQTSERHVFMTFGTSAAATRNFDRIFSFENPRKSYPRITDENWNLIINSQVTEGMTRDECRLALGIPSTIDRGSTPGAQLERWSYDNGIYLLFEDGILTKFRK